MSRKSNRKSCWAASCKRGASRQRTCETSGRGAVHRPSTTDARTRSSSCGCNLDFFLWGPNTRGTYARQYYKPSLYISPSVLYRASPNDTRVLRSRNSLCDREMPNKNVFLPETGISLQPQRRLHPLYVPRPSLPDDLGMHWTRLRTSCSGPGTCPAYGACIHIPHLLLREDPLLVV